MTDHANPRVLIVFNPTAGQASSLELDLRAARDVWQAHGWRVDLQPTTCAGDGTRIARAAAEQGYHIVVAAGGDGTVNEVVNGLVGTRTALAALPIGTVNVWVRELGLPLQPRAAAEALLHARTQRIDLGRAGNRYFLLMASAGFDAAVTAEVRSEEKRRLGIFAYIMRALHLASRFQGKRTRIVVDGRSIRGRVLMVVLGNSQLYGGFVKLAARANLNDGLLDVCIIRGKSLRGLPARLLSVLTRRYNLDPEVEYHRARQVLIEARQPLHVQVDGDPIGVTPMVFEAVPNAIYALLPADVSLDLLRAELPRSRRAWQRMLGWFGRRRSGIAASNRAGAAHKEQASVQEEMVGKQ